MSIFIKRIDEPDFGCEGVPEGKPICDKITFCVNGRELTLNVPEKLVWQAEIDENTEISDELFNLLKLSAADK